MEAKNTSQIINPMLDKVKNELIAGLTSNIDTELNLLKVELNSALATTKRKRNEIAKKVRQMKDEMWSKALKESKGNKEEAYKIYSKVTF